MIGDFHFIRPAWLPLLVPAALLWWLLRRRADATASWRGIVAPHLLAHLLSGEEKRSRLNPLTLVALGWFAAIIAIAGPTWRREPTLFAADTAALAIVIKVTASMKTKDVEPSRLERTVEKIQDLLLQRADAKTSLIAYAGTAHVVIPLTTDGGIIDTFAAALDPKIMPEDGDVAAEALRLADQTLAPAATGSILWITDSVVPEQTASLANWRKTSRTPVCLLPPLLPGPEWDAVKAASHSVNAKVTSLSADDSDVQELARAAKFSAVSNDESGDRWTESGYWITPVLAALLLPFFRKGWMIANPN